MRSDHYDTCFDKEKTYVFIRISICIVYLLRHVPVISSIINLKI